MRLALVFFAAVILAQSQPPSPTPPKVSQKNQQQGDSKKSKAETNQKSAPPSPITLYQNFAPITDGKQQQPSNPSKNESSGDGTAKIVSDTILAFATVAIAVLAYFQWHTLKEHKTAFETLAKHMGDGLTETKKAADAAKTSAGIAKDHLRISQCATIAIHPVGFLPTAIHSLRELPQSCIEFRIENTGLTMAKACYFHVQVFLTPTSIDRPSPLVTKRTDLGPRFPVGQITPTLQEMFPSEHPHMIEAEAKNGGLCIAGFIRYRDVFDEGLYLAFRGILNPRTLRFEMSSQLRPDGEQPDPAEDKLYG